jgi:hypothetical protein
VTRFSHADVSPNEPPEAPLRHWLPSRALKNLALHLGSPFRPWNAAVVSAMGVADRWRRNQFEAVPKEGVRIGLIAEENLAGNPLHLVLVLVLGGFVVLRRPRGRVAAIGLSLAAGALVFLLVIPWQPFNSRLHLSPLRARRSARGRGSGGTFAARRGPVCGAPSRVAPVARPGSSAPDGGSGQRLRAVAGDLVRPGELTLEKTTTPAHQVRNPQGEVVLLVFDVVI